jgi:hypothetical protein
MIENARKRVKMFSQFFDDQDISELQFLQFLCRSIAPTNLLVAQLALL